MSDLVERLTAWAGHAAIYGSEQSYNKRKLSNALTEAAARITELETSLAEAGKQLRENAETLAQVPAAIAEARRQALEEAAKVVDRWEKFKWNGIDIDDARDVSAQMAQSIRNLASDPLLDRQGKEGV